MQTPPGLDQDDETDTDAQEDEDEDFNDGDGYLDAATLRVKVGDASIDIVGPDAETVSDLFKIGLAGVAKLRGGVQ